MNIVRRFGLLASALALGGTAAAQERDLDREASEGRVYQGTAGAFGTPAVFTATLTAGSAVEIHALPVDGSDPLLKVFDAATGEQLAENDDRAGTLAASVRLYSATERRVRIDVAPALGAEAPDSARFTLLMLPSDYRPAPPRPIALGARLQGELESEGEQLFSFTGTQGELWELTLAAPEGSALDPMLEVYAGTATTGDVLASDDDGGGGLAAKVRFLVPRTGPYTARASAVGATGGAWSLLAGNGRAALAAPVATLRLADPIDGELAAEDAHVFRLDPAGARALARRGGVLLVEMTSGSEGFDPLLEAGFDTPLGFAPSLSDDDGGGETNARLTIDFAPAMADPAWLDSFRIRATGFQGGPGSYRITARAAESD